MSQVTPRFGLLSAALVTACSSGGSPDSAPIVNPADSCPVVISDADCDSSLRPIVFVHGTFGSGDNFALPAQLFGSNGYCQDRIVAIEYNSVNLNTDINDELDTLIDAVREQTGADQVELLGHSQGTSHCIDYLSDAERAAKVAHYINLSGDTTVPNDVPTLSISSENDLNSQPHHATNAEEQVTFDVEDHMQIASSPKAFAAIYKYLMGEEPKYTEVQCGDDEVTIDGIAETFGDNVPVTGGKLEVFELDGSPQKRGEPVLVVTSDDQGRAEPFTLKRLVAYEFRATDASGALLGHAYFPPFKRSNRLARFLAPSTNPLVSLFSTSPLKRGPGYAAGVFRTASGSFRFDLGDSLTVDGQEVLSDETAGSSTTTVGLFFSDQNENGTTDLGITPPAGPFVRVTDIAINAKKPRWVIVDWNGYKMRIPNWASDEGLVSVLLN